MAARGNPWYGIRTVYVVRGNTFDELRPGVWMPAADDRRVVWLRLACQCGAVQQGHVPREAAEAMRRRFARQHAACRAGLKRAA